MSTEENKTDAVEDLRITTEHAETYSYVGFEIKTEDARSILNLIQELKALARTAAIQVGDVVREVGDEEETGEVISVAEFHDEMVYRVKLFRPTRFTKEISYYEGEIEIVRRPQ